MKFIPRLSVNVSLLCVPLFAFAILRFATAGCLAAGTNVILWDTGNHFSDPVEFGKRDNWRMVPSDLLMLEANPPKASSDPGYYGREYAFNGDAVVENRRVLALFQPAKARLTVYAKGNGRIQSQNSSGFLKILELTPQAAGASPSDLIVVRNAADEICLRMESKASPQGYITIGFDLSEIISIQPSSNLTAFTIQAPMDYAVVPSFIADDLIFGSQDDKAGGMLSVPADTFLLGLLQGQNTEFVMTWPQGKQKLQLGLGAENGGRRSIESISFENDGKPFFIAPLADDGIWHKETLTPASLEKDVAISWKRPFPARWKTQLLEEAVKTTFAFREAKGEIWRGVPGSYNYPVWFEGDQAFYHLSKKVPPKGESLIYFVEGQGTPEGICPPSNILKETLGRASADSILDVNGRKLRTHHRRGGDGVHRACTCGCTEAIQAVFESHEEVQRKQDIKEDLEDMVFFVHGHVNRISEYRRFADELVKELEQKKASSADLVEYIDQMEQIVRQIPQECDVQRENMKSFVYADELVRRTMALTKKNDPNNLKAYLELLKEWRAMGGAQDYVLAQCHIITRKLAQEAAYRCVSKPKAVALAQEIRARAQQCLRNPDGYEIWADY